MFLIFVRSISYSVHSSVYQLKFYIQSLYISSVLHIYLCYIATPYFYSFNSTLNIPCGLYGYGNLPFVFSCTVTLHLLTNVFQIVLIDIGHACKQPAEFGICSGGDQFGHSPVCNKIPLRIFGSKNNALPSKPATARLTGYGPYNLRTSSGLFKSNDIKPVGVFPDDDNWLIPKSFV